MDEITEVENAIKYMKEQFETYKEEVERMRRLCDAHVILIEKHSLRNSRFEDFIKRVQFNFENNDYKQIYSDIINFRSQEDF